MNRRHWISIWSYGIGAAAVSLASAQTSPGSAPAPMVQRSPAGIDHISGGAGVEERATMAARQSEFPLRSR